MANRKEELELLEAQARERFLNLESADEIKAFLKGNGAYQRDVDRIYVDRRSAGLDRAPCGGAKFVDFLLFAFPGDE